MHTGLGLLAWPLLPRWVGTRLLPEPVPLSMLGGAVGVAHAGCWHRRHGEAQAVLPGCDSCWPRTGSCVQGLIPQHTRLPQPSLSIALLPTLSAGETGGLLPSAPSPRLCSGVPPCISDLDWQSLGLLFRKKKPGGNGMPLPQEHGGSTGSVPQMDPWDFRFSVGFPQILILRLQSVYNEIKANV